MSLDIKPRPQTKLKNVLAGFRRVLAVVQYRIKLQYRDKLHNSIITTGIIIAVVKHTVIDGLHLNPFYSKEVSS